MQPSRRSVLIKLSALLASGSVYPSVLGATSTSETLNVETFETFIDVLLPDDGVSPSGSSIGISRDLLKLAEDSSQYNKLITFGCSWLDTTGSGPFGTLSDADQITVVQWMSTSDWNQIPRRFYYLTRQAAIELYYSSAYATIGLPLNAAPQPDGYLPPWD